MLCYFYRIVAVLQIARAKTRCFVAECNDFITTEDHCWCCWSTWSLGKVSFLIPHSNICVSRHRTYISGTKTFIAICLQCKTLTNQPTNQPTRQIFKLINNVLSFLTLFSIFMISHHTCGSLINVNEQFKNVAPIVLSH